MHFDKSYAKGKKVRMGKNVEQIALRALGFAAAEPSPVYRRGLPGAESAELFFFIMRSDL